MGHHNFRNNLSGSLIGLNVVIKPSRVLHHRRRLRKYASTPPKADIPIEEAQGCMTCARYIITTKDFIFSTDGLSIFQVYWTIKCEPDIYRNAIGSHKSNAAMNSTEICVLAALAVLIVIIGVVLLYQRTGGKKPEYSSNKAASGLQESLTLLRGDLACINTIATRIERRGQTELRRGPDSHAGTPPNTGAFTVRQKLEGARRGMGPIIDSLRRFQPSINSMPPTHSNILGLYRGLRDSDSAFRETAKALNDIGESMSGSATQPDRVDSSFNLVGGDLKQLSACLYSLTRSVHQIGANLGLE